MVEFLKQNFRWIAGGFLLTYFSSFGQTFLVSASIAEWQAQFDLSHGEIGRLYMFATLGNALSLPVLGRIVDVLPESTTILLVVPVLAAATLLAAHDWVMVPNAYAMSQHADGGLVTTKPCFSGSSCIRKMSNCKTGPWCEIRDGLYWRWIWNHADELAKNPRWAMMCAMAKKMDATKRKTHLRNAAKYLKAVSK